ncbi:MAG TPA: tetratricopeptide repeat protein [Drouetiella sp.]|jgi:tetratricopeptide (TPR) repeat protein
MNTKFQSQVLAAVLVLASATISVQPSYAASSQVTKTVSATTLAGTVDTDSLWNQVSSLLKAGNFDQALAIANQAIQADPNNSTAYVIKAFVMYTASADSQSTITVLNKALDLAPNNADALFMRGLVYEDMNDLASAGKDFDACIALNNHDLGAFSESVKVKYAQKDWNGMLSVLNFELANNQGDGEAYFFKAIAEYQLGQTTAAVADFKQAQSMFVADNDTKDAQTVAQILQQLQAV